MLCIRISSNFDFRTYHKVSTHVQLILIHPRTRIYNVHLHIGIYPKYDPNPFIKAITDEEIVDSQVLQRRKYVYLYIFYNRYEIFDVAQCIFKKFCGSMILPDSM